ncbi:DUF2946 domain-containing protein [Salinicola sp. CPA57]|uniref:DUF2946 domain-containing protein n=1 Tax=Salinicola sp. CPA57 TaxID=1949080 RepID=UPI000DA151F0|nr:DUF2946 domain-containing protein [Salinicola sp. CPA57]
MTHFCHRWNRSLTALALFAMLMAFTGPLISQMQRLMEMPSGAMAGMTHHGAADTHNAGDSGATGDAHLVSHFDMAACGYCDLFLHAPGLEPPREMPPVTPPPVVFRPMAMKVSPSTAPIYPRYASRAPPLA